MLSRTLCWTIDFGKIPFTAACTGRIQVFTDLDCKTYPQSTHGIRGALLLLGKVILSKLVTMSALCLRKSGLLELHRPLVICKLVTCKPPGSLPQGWGKDRGQTPRVRSPHVVRVKTNDAQIQTAEPDLWWGVPTLCARVSVHL